MHSEEEDPPTERERRYQNRSHRKYDYTTADLEKGQDKGKAPESVNDKDKEEKELKKKYLAGYARYFQGDKRDEGG